jgi:uncharacterized protein
MTTNHKSGRLLYLLAILSTLALILAACGDDADDPADADDTSADADGDDADGDDADADHGDGFLVLGTGSTGGTYYPLGGAMVEVWNSEIGLNMSTSATGASVENLRLLGTDLDLVMAVNGVAHDAIEGTGEFEGDDYDFVSLGNVYPEVLQIVARADAGITSIEDLEGKRIAIGPPGSGTEIAARTILGYLGIDVDSDVDAFSETFGDATDQLRDGTIDAAFGILALPAGGIEEVATSTDIVIVNIEGEALDQLLADDDSYSTIDVPAGTYTGFDEDAQTVANWATLYAPSDIDDDLAYDLVRVLYESTDRIAQTIAVGEQINVETAVDGLGPVPLSPGAERYFEEQGALD